MNNQGLSIIIPTYNEAENIRELITRITKAFDGTDTAYEILFIDDHSTDATRSTIKKTKINHSVQLFVKEGKRGKGYSILEGVKRAQYSHIAMLDGDLQYPPEILPQLYEKAQSTGFAVANRKTYISTPIRRLLSRANAYLFGKLLLGLDTDIQSGLKVFHREVFERLDTKLISAWAIDIPLIHTAYNIGYAPSHVDIDFHPRDGGKSKVNLIKTSWEIAMGAVKTKLFYTRVHTYKAPSDTSMLGSGFAYKRKRFTTHTSLPHHQSALVTIIGWQKLLLTIIVAGLAYGMVTNWMQTAIIFIGILSSIYFLDVLFNLYVVLKSLHFPPEIQVEDDEISKLADSDLPIYTILCPLYREAQVLQQFVEAMEHMDWPKNKLEVLLLLEEDDQHTIDAANSMQLPEYVRVVVVPHGEPKTKPKASNYGLSIARGEYVVVYDAEDKPEPAQLKKVYIAFSKQKENVVCLQAKLNYYNPHDNLLTRMFTAEYSLWFDVILPGLQSINTTIPLGGTSNHFRTAKLIELQGWDPFNVTEDCDLGARLFASGYKTAIVDSTTMEEANSDAKNWFRQRSRWIKGYIQTYLVQMRDPMLFFRQHGWHAFIFQLIVGGRISFMLINPILWAITISYFTLYWLVGPTIESLYPTAVFYVAVISLVFGNFIYLYNYMIGCAKRGHWDLIKYTFFIPFYWLMMSWGAVIALYQLIFRPHYWEKTIHGLHLDKMESDEKKRLMRASFGESARGRYAKIRRFAESRIFGGGLLIAGSFVGNFLNFIYNAYLGRNLKLEDFGEIILISSILNMTSIPLGSYMKTITYRSAYLLGMYKKPVERFWLYQRRIAFLLSIVLAFLWVLSIPFLQDFFRTSDKLPLLLFTPVLLIGLVSSVDSGYLSGNLKFRILAFVLFSEPVSKLIITFVLVQLHLHAYVFAAVPASLIISFLVGWYLLSRIPYTNTSLPEVALKHFPKRFLIGAILNKVSHVLYMNMDILLAKHFLSPTDAGSYAFVSLGGKMVYYSSNIFTQFINPLIAHAEGAGKNSTKTFSLLMVPIVLSSMISYILIGLLGQYTVPFLFGPKALPIVGYLPLYALSIGAFSIASSITTYYLAKRKYVYPIINFAITAIQIGVVFLYHSTMFEFIVVMIVSGLVNLLCIYAAHLYFLRRESHYRQPNASFTPASLKILIFNWRDTKHKWCGGAEVYIHQIAKRWVKKGHTVTVFCGNDGTKPRNEVIDGVQIIRRGGTYLVYIWAFFYYKFVYKGNFDIIIDSENGIPFFTPLYVKEKVYLLIHHVHQDVFRKSLRPPLSWIGIFLERRLMPLVYRNIEIITVSPSSKTDILENKLTSKDPHVIYNGVDLAAHVPGAKHKVPTVLYLGRLTSLKSVDILIHAAKKISAVLPKVRFVIAGDGPERANLTKLVRSLGLENIVTLIGKVSEEEKIRHYQQSWVFVNPSLIEGWGITTIEANACGTPVVASNVAGLRDAVHNPHSGLLVPYGDVNEFTNAIIELLTKQSVRNRMSAEAIDWAKKYDWEKSADNFEQLILANDIPNVETPSGRSYDMLRLLTTTLIEMATRRIGTHASIPSFPRVVGDYTFIRRIKKIGPKHSYEIALYRDHAGRKIFAKMRSSRVHDYHYFSLKNEIRTYKVLTHVRKRVSLMLPSKYKKMVIPKFLAVHEDSETLIMFLEYRKGYPIANKPEKNRVSTFMLAAQYLTFLGDNMTPEERKIISTRTPEHMMMLLPFLTGKTLLHHREHFGRIAAAVHIIVSEYFAVRKTWDSAFIHRDLHFRNILSEKNDSIIIDFQQCVYADRLQEYVTILRYYWKSRPEAITIHNQLLQELKETPGFARRMRWLSLHSVIHGLTDPTFPKETTDRWVEFLDYAIQPDSFTKNIRV